MLKSTYRPLGGSAPLPPGWTEHKAPTGVYWPSDSKNPTILTRILRSTFANGLSRLGHLYYYNTATQESTYNRPSEIVQPPATSGIPSFPQTPYGAFNPLVSHWGNTSHGAYQNNTFPNLDSSHGKQGPSFGRDFWQRALPQDRPKSKHVIPGCSPWLLVKTKLGRRFVYNPEKGESFWKFPLDVMKGVVEYDRLEREKKLCREENDNGEADPKVENEEPISATISPGEAALNASNVGDDIVLEGDDGEEYEEVEVTDDEEDENPSKRQKTENDDAERPVEFDEDDIAYQLAAMGQDYGLDPGEYGDMQDEDLEEGAEGLALTEEEAVALFREMLDDYHINPYFTWEKLIEIGHIVQDHRYIVLPNMKSRKDVWADWSREKVQSLKQIREQNEKRDPRIPYLDFLQRHATPKLYWPEFRRKYKKEPELRDTKLSDKDREKAYREYIGRQCMGFLHQTMISSLTNKLPGLKLPESTLKSDLINLLKSISSHTLNRSTSPSALPPILLTDLRYASLRPSIRDPLIETYISTLPPPPLKISENSLVAEQEDASSREKREKEEERRERALTERQKQVQEEKRRQRGALQFSKGVLREGEAEIERAMRVTKEGLKGHLVRDL